MQIHKEHKPMWIPVPGMENKNIRALFTTRHGGVSLPPFHTMNLSFQRGDSYQNVRENFSRLAGETGISFEQMVLTRQVHGATISLVDKTHCGMGLTKDHTLGDTDGLITAEKGVALVTFHADCAPVYLVDPAAGVIGLVHSGWRSTLANIAVKAVSTMKQVFHCRSENIHAIMGPHIGACCFEVGQEVYEMFFKAFPDCHDIMLPKDGKWMIHLGEVIKRSLCKEGLSPERISDMKRCTVCEKDLFFSHRGGRGISGTGIALLMMVE